MLRDKNCDITGVCPPQIYSKGRRVLTFDDMLSYKVCKICKSFVGLAFLHPCPCYLYGEEKAIKITREKISEYEKNPCGGIKTETTR